MIRLLRLLITGTWHEHKWELEDKDDTTICLDNNFKVPLQFVRTYVQKCAVCGKLKITKVAR